MRSKLAAILALAFLASCGDDGGTGGSGGNGGNGSSDDGQLSSSGGEEPDSMQTLAGTMTYGGRTYKTIQIGSQTWMAENLNYEYKVEGSTYGNFCYKLSADSCGKYGRLYTWAAAMDTATTGCGRGAACSASSGRVQGVCPNGWHLPDSAEWEALFGSSAAPIARGRRLERSRAGNPALSPAPRTPTGFRRSLPVTGALRSRIRKAGTMSDSSTAPATARTSGLLPWTSGATRTSCTFTTLPRTSTCTETTSTIVMPSAA